MDQRPTIPIAQLVNSIAAPYQDERGRSGKKRGKYLEPCGNLSLVGRRPSPLAPPQGILYYERNEYTDEENLKGETGNRHVDSRSVATGGTRGQRSANGLEDETEDVAGDENPVVEFGGEARVFRTKIDDDSGERQVDCGREKGWTKGDADYRILVSGIPV